MASVSESRLASAVRGLFSLDVYKRNQGRRVRSLTAAGVGLLVAWGLLALATYLDGLGVVPWVQYGVPVGVGMLAAWAIFRLVNWPPFADFLIATEAEMTKVSWPKRQELVRATVVVIVTLLLLTAYLLGVDLIWSWFLEQIGIIQTAPAPALQASVTEPAWLAALCSGGGLSESIKS